LAQLSCSEPVSTSTWRGVSVHFLFWRKKTVEDEAATKDGIEVGDDEGLEPWLDDDKKKLREK
jgi:hypothetical protein